jgi:hypothetical protein
MIKLKNLLNEISYKDSDLENPDLADRDKDHKISSWEKKVSKKIDVKITKVLNKPVKKAAPKVTAKKK